MNTEQKPALLIIDMMNLFDFEGGPALGKAAVACSRVIARLRKRFDDAGAPVIYVNDNFARWQGDFNALLAQCAFATEHSRDIAHRLAPRPGHYHVLKPKHSGFRATPLGILLAKLCVRQLVLTGIAADSCVLATATDAKMREYEVWVPSDAVAAITPSRKSTALALIRTSLEADVCGTRAVKGLFPTQASR